MYYPIPFDELLEEFDFSPVKIARVKKWLEDQIEYYEWCAMIWSVTELEKASEEYAFTCIYEALTDICKLHALEPQIRAITKEFPGGEPENMEVWKWYKKHEKFYRQHLLYFETHYQDYEYHMLGHRENLTVPIACFRENVIFLDKEDFIFVFDLVEIYKPLIYKLIPDEVSHNPDFIAFVKNLGKDADNSEEEYRRILEEERALEEEDIVGKSALQHLISFNETMVDMSELEEWVEQHAYVKKRLEDNHDADCDCCLCNDFNILWKDMADIVNAYHQKEAFRRFLDEYDASDKDTKSLAKLFLKNFSFVKSIKVPDDIRDISPGIVSYRGFFGSIGMFSFVFADEPWNTIYRDLTWFSGMMNAMYYYLLDRFNAMHKSFYLEYDFNKICESLGDSLMDDASFFFGIYYELANECPHLLTPEGKFLY